MPAVDTLKSLLSTSELPGQGIFLSANDTRELMCC